MKKIAAIIGGVLGVLLLAGIGAYLYLRPSPASSSLTCFASLPPDFLAAWQVDRAALRGSLPAAMIDSKLDADRVCGVLTPEPKTASEGGPPRATAIPNSAAKTLSHWEERRHIPPGSQGWLVARKLRELPRLRAIPISAETTVELPGEVMTAKWVVVSVQAGTVSVALVAEAAYQDEAEAQRAASAMRGFLSLVKNVTSSRRARVADQALQSLLSSTIVETEGNLVFLKAATPQ